MGEIRANLYDCQHCKGEGTCRSGNEGCSCSFCIKASELKKGQAYTGLVCQVCGGIGKAEPFTERLNKRAAPLLAIFLSGALILLIFTSFFFPDYTHSIISFSSSILGVIVGFYFFNIKNKGK